MKLTADAIRRHGIRVARVEKMNLAAAFVAPARVAFNGEAMAHVGSVVKGRAAKLNVRVGDHVKQGDILLVVESVELGEAQSQLLQKRTAAEAAEPAVNAARGAYERAKALHDQNQGIALGEVQKREVEYRVAEGALRGAKAAAIAAENTLHLMGMDQQAVDALVRGGGEIAPQLAVRAPIDGQVIRRDVTLGELVSPERDALLVLANTDTYWVLADVAEARLDGVRVGAKARVTVASLPNAVLEGTVTHVAPAVDPETRSVQVRVEVANGHTGLRAGMFARAELTSGAAGEPALAVPEDAIQLIEGKPSVFVPVAGEENTFAHRAVSVGKTVGGAVPVLEGLKEGEPVVVSGSFILKAELGKGEAGHGH